MRFVDLFSGLGGFHLALSPFGGDCVFALDIDDELRGLYQRNYGLSARQLGADIRDDWRNVPNHDVLCAGFPCQPFSKSGAQLGRKDQTRGTLFDFVLRIASKHKPKLIILENVGNFARHDSGNTWRIVQASLARIGYTVVGTEHLNRGGSGLLSPHHLGFPHVRERFFAVASLNGFRDSPLPQALASSASRQPLSSFLQKSSELSATQKIECSLSPRQVRCIDHWNEFVQSIPSTIELPAFPIWGDEFGAKYPTDRYLSSVGKTTLRRFIIGSLRPPASLSRDELLLNFPAYMRNGEGALPRWKSRFLEQNRHFFKLVRRYLRKGWLEELREFPPSLRKLEWNCHGEERNLWKYVLQFRPSGLRAKRFTSIPALVAMTTTQIPILGPQKRFLTCREGARLQGMPDTLILPASRAKVFHALGNAVHVGVVQSVYRQASGVLLRRGLAQNGYLIKAG